MDNAELIHHGIKGMKWGVRRFQDKSGRLTNAGKKRYSEDSGDSKKQGLTDKQKREIKIGAAVGAYKLGKSGKLDRLINKGKQACENVHGLDSNAVKSKLKFESISDVIKNVNPTKSNTNCRACSIASALRLKGINAEALDIGGGSFGEAIDKSFTGVKRAEMYDASKDKVTRYISKKYTNGDYGVISSGFNMPNGKSYEHAYNWKVENNAVKFFDGQQEISDASIYLDFINPGKMTEICGLTNAVPNLEAIQSFVRLR